MQLRGIDAALRFTTKVCFLAVLLHLRCLGQVTEIAPRRSSLSEGVEVIAKVAELGDPVSQRYLGVAYLFGKGVMQDFSQAVFWFSKASLQGDQPAQNELADCFEFGRGVKRNLPIALGIRRKLANEGYGHAQMLLGLSYFMDGIRLDWPTGIQTNYEIGRAHV